MNKYRGFTLVELVITVIIGAMFFMAIGTLLFRTQEGWNRALTYTTLQQDYRAARQRMEYALRNSTGPYEISSDSMTIRFFTGDGVTNRQYWYDPINRQVKEATVGLSLSNIGVLLPDVEEFLVRQSSVAAGTFVFSLIRSTISYHKEIEKADTFSVTSRVYSGD